MNPNLLTFSNIIQVNLDFEAYFMQISSLLQLFSFFAVFVTCLIKSQQVVLLFNWLKSKNNQTQVINLSVINTRLASLSLCWWYYLVSPLNLRLG